MIRIALAGDPNCGKSTLFNLLTGSNQYVGNWTGVTVEKKDGRLRGHPDVIIQDLPGIYSLSPYTQEEMVTRRYLVEEKPDIILNIVDGTHIERNLYLTTQLLELGIPVVTAINMMDQVRKRGDKIEVDKLARELRCPVVPICALKGEGIMELTKKVLEAASRKPGEPLHLFAGSTEHALAHIEESLQGRVPDSLLRWYAVKVFERDAEIMKELDLPAKLSLHLDEHIHDCEKEQDDDAESILIDQRYKFIQDVVAHTVRKKHPAGTLTFSDKVDRIVTNRILALPVFALVIWLMYWISVTTLGGWMTDWANNGLFGEGWFFFGKWVPGIPVLAERFLNWAGANGMAQSLVLDGVIGGVGTVLGFVPQIMLVFLFLAFLEDCGYMARVAFIMDRFFRHFGLSGKSFIPMIVGTGCGVPAIMAARTIESERDRRMTIMLCTFIPCGAKVEIIAAIAGAFFPGSLWVAPGMFFLGVGIVLLSGLALRKTKAFSGDTAPFALELPEYHIPALRTVLRHTWDRGKGFCIKAGTVIFALCVILWFLMSFSWGLHYLETPESDGSILAGIGRCVAWMFAPLGFGDWRGAVAVFSAEIAKEQAVATLGMLAGAQGNGGSFATLFASFSAFPKLAAFSFLLLNLFNPPCIVAVVTAFRELQSRLWGWMTFFFQFLVGYSLAFVAYQLGKVFLYGQPFGVGAFAAVLLLLAALYFILRPEEK